MYKPLLLAAVVGAAAILPAPASAHGHGSAPPNVVSSLGLRIILSDGPKVVHHHHPPRRFFHPPPFKFKHYNWHRPRHQHTRHFRGRDADHHWFKHGRHKGWVHAPAQRAKFKHHGHWSRSRHHR